MKSAVAFIAKYLSFAALGVAAYLLAYALYFSDSSQKAHLRLSIFPDVAASDCAFLEKAHLDEVVATRANEYMNSVASRRDAAGLGVAGDSPRVVTLFQGDDQYASGDISKEFQSYGEYTALLDRIFLNDRADINVALHVDDKCIPRGFEIYSSTYYDRIAFGEDDDYTAIIGKYVYLSADEYFNLYDQLQLNQLPASLTYVRDRAYALYNRQSDKASYANLIGMTYITEWQESPDSKQAPMLHDKQVAVPGGKPAGLLRKSLFWFDTALAASPHSFSALSHKVDAELVLSGYDPAAYDAAIRLVLGKYYSYGNRGFLGLVGRLYLEKSVRRGQNLIVITQKTIEDIRRARMFVEAEINTYGGTLLDYEAAAQIYGILGEEFLAEKYTYLVKSVQTTRRFYLPDRLLAAGAP